MLKRALLPRLAIARRALSSAASGFNLEKALFSNHLVIGELESPAAQQQLQHVQSQGDTMTKWQQTNAVLVQATLRVLPQLGFTADGPGLQQYSEAFAAMMRDDAPEVRETLRGLNESKWKVLLKGGFGCEPVAAIPLSRAREIAIDMVDALQEETLLKQVEEARTGLAARLPEAERQHMVARALVGVQAEVMARHGFAGDAGYAQAQVCLMDHAQDAVVTASVAHATTQVYHRAGINLQQALAQAASTMSQASS